MLSAKQVAPVGDPCEVLVSVLTEQAEPPPRVYLAGPEVFLPKEDQKLISAAKIAICTHRGLQGVYPGDAELDLEGKTPAELSREIYVKDVQLMKTCVAIAANLTPFRGVSADAGTCWELGHFVGERKACVAYTNCHLEYEDRCELPAHAVGLGLSRDHEGTLRDKQKQAVDMQRQADNCMMTESVMHLARSTKALSPAEALTDLTAFTECIDVLARFLLKGQF